jgi:hypothetical protein
VLLDFNILRLSVFDSAHGSTRFGAGTVITLLTATLAAFGHACAANSDPLPATTGQKLQWLHLYCKGMAELHNYANVSSSHYIVLQKLVFSEQGS